MSNTLHKLYLKKSIVLARTMVIKFHEVALAINEHLKTLGYAVNENDPTTWKYYMNMFGEYHQYDHDRLLQLSDGKHKYLRVKVAGENQPVEVDFTKELLYGNGADLAIANEYRFNTQYYNEIVTKYPDFREIINGVLNPIDPTISTTSNDGEILYCGGYLKTKIADDQYMFIRQEYGPISENYLIESNEENLLYMLQEEINLFIHRWSNVNYNRTANLFYPIFLGILFANIPGWIGNIRLYNVKSVRGFTHSYHIRQYLDSHGKLGWTTDHVKKSTALWVYRNLMWLTANRGKDMVFQALIENVLTPEGIPLTGHRLRHDINQLGDEGHLTPTVFMERKPLNFENRPNTSLYHSVLDITKQERPLAVENYYDQFGQAKKTMDKSTYSMFDNVNTKVLESTVMDMSNHKAITLDDLALNLWAFSASKGFYRGTILATNPLTSDRIQLTPLSAYILALYCLNKGWADYEMEYVPEMYIHLVKRDAVYTPSAEFNPLPKVDEVKKGVNSEYISDDEIKEIIGDYKPQYRFGSQFEFTEELKRLHKEAIRQYYAYVKLEDMNARAYGEFVAHKTWWYDIPISLVKQKTKYAEWIKLQGIDLTNFTRQDYVGLGLSLVEAATGLDIAKGEKLRNKQNAVLSILRHFSSYTVQIIQNSVSYNSFYSGLKPLRYTNLKKKLRSSHKLKLPLITADVQSSLKDPTFKVSPGSTATSAKVNEKFKSRWVIDVNDIRITGLKEKQKFRLNLPRNSYGLIAELPKPAVSFTIELDRNEIFEKESIRVSIIAENVDKVKDFVLTVEGLQTTRYQYPNQLTPIVHEYPFTLNDNNRAVVVIQTEIDSENFGVKTATVRLRNAVAEFTVKPLAFNTLTTRPDPKRLVHDNKQDALAISALVPLIKIRNPYIYIGRYPTETDNAIAINSGLGLIKIKNVSDVPTPKVDEKVVEINSGLTRIKVRHVAGVPTPKVEEEVASVSVGLVQIKIRED